MPESQSGSLANNAKYKDDNASLDGLGPSLLVPANEFLADDTHEVLGKVANLPPRASSPLKDLNCLPKMCSIAKHFIEDKKALADAKNFMVLSSAPGSGNTFLRSVCEEGTRIYSGSMYHDVGLKKEYGFQGEMLDPWEGSFSRMSVIKSHYVRNPSTFSTRKLTLSENNLASISRQVCSTQSNGCYSYY